MIRFGVIGYGYWGPNIVQKFRRPGGCQVVAICDQREACLHRAKKTYPRVRLTRDSSDVLRSPDIDAVAVITPVWTHFELRQEALENGKHVFVEKPFTATSARPSN